MKQLLICIIALMVFESAAAQVLERRYLIHQDRNRTYLIYIPSTYDASSGERVPLVFAFHGINATDENLVGVGLNDFAERDNFIVVYPQAVPSEFGMIAWNCGTVLATNIDDTGYFISLLELISAEYNIDDRRVYTCGFSMGGMMSYRLACEYSDRIAAVASVSGPLTNTVYGNCEPVRKMPVMHFHGLSDQTVAYFGNGWFGVKGAMATMLWWANRDGCDEDYITEAVPDTADDYYHFDKLTFQNCDDDYEVIHYRIQNWPHSWPGPSRNVYATEEIVDFFMRHELQQQDIVLTSSSGNQELELTPLPNPFKDQLDLTRLNVPSNPGTGQIVWAVYNSGGQEMAQGSELVSISTSDWATGVYVFRLSAGDRTFIQRMIRE